MVEWVVVCLMKLSLVVYWSGDGVGSLKVKVGFGDW